jgi:hypothetical protein
MRLIKQSSEVNIMVFMTDSTDHVTGKTGLTLTITLSKDGAAFASISPTVTQRGNGWYNVALVAGDTNTNGDLCMHVTGSGADPSDLKMLVVAFDPNSATNLGLSNIDAAVSTRALETGGNVAAVKAKTDNLPSDPADESLLEAAIATRMASFSYTAPDNAGIAAIKAKTDNLPASPAAVSDIPTVTEIKDEIFDEILP